MIRSKAEWRRVLLAARRAIEPGSRRARSAAMMDRAARLPCFASARTIFGYVAMGAEADPARLLEGTGAAHVLIPVSSLHDRVPIWKPWGCLRPGDRGVGESSDNSVAYPALVLVPGVGFDHGGMRLGRGLGFYDRALAALRRAGEVHVVGLAFECQIVSALPFDPWDERVDCLVSETRVITPTTSIDTRLVPRS